MSKIWWVTDDQLNPIQLSAIEYAGKGRGFVLKGPPGSGKTNVLMLSLAAIKERHFVNSKGIVFTGSLRRFIESGLDLYGLEQGDVITLKRLAGDILREHGDQGLLKNELPFQSLQKIWRERFKSYLEGVSHCLYDSLIVDESQDFDESEVRMLYAASRYTVFAIDTNQSVYIRSDAKHPVIALREREGLQEFTLNIHYRVGYTICKFVDLLMEGRAGYFAMQGSSQYTEALRPSLVELEQKNSAEDEFEVIINRARNQSAVYPGETIGIVFPKRDQVASFEEYCERNAKDVLDLARLGRHEFGANVFIGSMHESKGLEFAVIHIGGLETLSKFQTQRTLMFTAVTRARYACYITSSGKVPDYVSSAYRRLKGIPDVAVKSLFRKGQPK